MEACAVASRAARPRGEAPWRTGLAAGLVLVSLAAAALAFLSPAGARAAAGPSLDVVFAANGTITVALADGTPVGSASGAPTVVPAGYYTVLLSGPGGCVMLPTFDLSGPGVSIVNNLDDGEVNSTGLQTELEPNSTYTWSDNASPGVVYTFTTSAQVEGSPPAPSSSAPSGAPVSVSSQDVVGSQVGARPPAPASPTPFRGRLVAAVSAAGRLSLVFDGRPVSRLRAGRYTLSVTDRSRSGGFALGEAGHPALSVAHGAFAGTRSASVDLTAGRWFADARPLGARTSFLVSS